MSRKYDNIYYMTSPWIFWTRHACGNVRVEDVNVCVPLHGDDVGWECEWFVPNVRSILCCINGEKVE